MAYEFNDDMSVATPLIDSSNKSANQWVCGIYVEGTQAGGDRKIYLVNDHVTDTAHKGLVRYSLGGNAMATTGDTGTQIIGPAYFGTDNVPYDVARDSNGDWYVDGYRAITGAVAPIAKFYGTNTLPMNTPAWAASSSYYYAWGIDISELNGLAAYGHAYDGKVYFFKLATGAFVESLAAGGAIRDVAFDAAGNMVTVDNVNEWARFWSPGGYTVATTTFDGTQTTFALSNLVENAVKYGRREGTVTVTGEADDTGCRFEVADDGPGISPEHLPRIFERFYRVEKGRSRDRGGTGLGLSIVKHIVESHGGTVAVESVPGAGARFTIRAPPLILRMFQHNVYC